MKAQSLAENPVNDDYKPLDTYFPDEEINSIEEVGLMEMRLGNYIVMEQSTKRHRSCVMT